MADRFDYSDAPELVRRFLNYKSGVQNRSKMTVYNYYHDLLTFSRFLLKTKQSEKYRDTANEEISFSDADDELFRNVTNNDIFEFMSFAANTLNNEARSDQKYRSNQKRSTTAEISFVGGIQNTACFGGWQVCRTGFCHHHAVSQLRFACFRALRHRSKRYKHRFQLAYSHRQRQQRTPHLSQRCLPHCVGSLYEGASEGCQGSRQKRAVYIPKPKPDQCANRAMADL